MDIDLGLDLDLYPAEKGRLRHEASEEEDVLWIMVK